jgi:hypothetical protein
MLSTVVLLPRTLRLSCLAMTATVLLVLALSAGAIAAAQSSPLFLTVSQIHPGMQGTGYTIFAGDTIESFHFEVLGIMPNLLGPKADIILVKLSAGTAKDFGVAAGMSGSPLYIDGKLIGALSLRFGDFTREAIGGVTPIEDMLNSNASTVGPPLVGFAADNSIESSARALQPTPMETPLVVSGFYRSVLMQFAQKFAALGITVGQGGAVDDIGNERALVPGDMAAMVLSRGDLTLSASCTVTAVIGDQIYACGHPVLGFGKVLMPLARAHVLTTIDSPLSPTKIINVGSLIGTVTEDRSGGVVGKLGPAPPMIPVELAIKTSAAEQHLHFEVVNHPQLTPLLVALGILNGLSANVSSIGDSALQLNGTISLDHHAAVHLQDTFAPSEQTVTDGYFVASSLESLVSRILNNPYEEVKIKSVELTLRGIPKHRWARIDSAWTEKTEVASGDTLAIKVLLRPYRGPAFVQTVSVKIPEDVSHGPLRIMVSDSDSLNRTTHLFTSDPQIRLAGIDELIRLQNRYQRNDWLYVSILEASPTVLLQDKELPNAPISQVMVLGPRRDSGDTVLLWESAVGQSSVPMDQVIIGQQFLTIMVR